MNTITMKSITISELKKLTPEELSKYYKITEWNESTFEIKWYIDFSDKILDDMREKLKRDFPTLKIYISSIFIGGYIDPDGQDPYIDIEELEAIDY